MNLTSRFGAGWALAAAAALSASGPAAGAVNAIEASILHLRSAVHSQRDGSHLALLLALRQLRDPSLRPLFLQLVQHREWQVQVHAVLGLAEVDPSGRINPWHITQIAQLAQEAAIASALDLKLLGPDQIPELLAWSELHPMARLLLYAEQLSQGKDADRKELRKLSENSEYRIAALAALLLAHVGDAGPLEGMHERLRENGRAGDRKLLWMLDAIRQYRLTATEPWLRELLSEPELDREVMDTAVFSAVSLDPVKNIDLWHTSLGSEPALSRRVRYGLMLLHCGATVPASAYDRIARHDELTARIAEAGRGLSTGIDVSSAIIELLNFGHVRSMEWALDASSSLDQAEARRIYLHVLDRLDSVRGAADARGREPGAEWVASGIKAASKLFALDPALASQKLAGSDPRGQARQALLLGMLESNDPAAGDAARLLDLSGFSRADSLGLLLLARHAGELSKEELSRLGLIASGGGRLSAELRAQAAWLFIRHSGAVETALSRIFQ